MRGTPSRVCSGVLPGEIAPAPCFCMLTALPSRAWHTQESSALRPALVYARVGREGELAEDVENPLFCSSRSERPDVYR